MARPNKKLHYPDSNYGTIFPPDNLLVFEGNEEFHTFFALFNLCGLLEKFHFEPGGGYEKLRDDLPFILKQSGLQRLGIVVDADTDALSRWGTIRERLLDRACGYTELPEQLDATGIVVAEHGKPRIGVWIMPNNQEPGALEEFIRCLIPSDDMLWPYAEDVVAKLPKLPYPTDDGKFNWESKARLHSWLAWQREPGKPIGQAITKEYLNTEGSEARKFLDWLRNTFEC